MLHAYMAREIAAAEPPGGGGSGGKGEGQPRARLAHIGTIYDSVPARTDSEQAVRGVGSALVGMGPAKGLVLWPLRAALAAAEVLGVVQEAEDAYHSSFETLAARGTPQLFVHSGADEVCPIEPLESLLGDLRGLGRDCDNAELVQLLRVDGAAHVTAWRDCHAEYAAAVERFVGEAVERDSTTWTAFKTVLGSR